MESCGCTHLGEASGSQRYEQLKTCESDATGLGHKYISRDSHLAHSDAIGKAVLCACVHSGHDASHMHATNLRGLCVVLLQCGRMAASQLQSVCNSKCGIEEWMRLKKGSTGISLDMCAVHMWLALLYNWGLLCTCVFSGTWA